MVYIIFKRILKETVEMWIALTVGKTIERN